MSSSTPANGDLRRFIRDVPDFPKPGILFKDITPLLLDPSAFKQSIEVMAAFTDVPDAVVAIESRGFLFGTALALRWNVPLIPARKPGKLPAATTRETYALEYGEDALEIHTDAFKPGQRIVIVDDLLATGGTAAATARLVEKTGAQVDALLFLIELKGLPGRQALDGRRIHVVMDFDVSSPARAAQK